jgi:hypothetical protein
MNALNISSQDYWENDGISLTGNPSSPSPDYIKLDSTTDPIVQNKTNNNNFWKYTENKILKDIEEYIITTYKGHYCGDTQGYEDIQTIDLMAAKGLASSFCQANILKYGSRYGDKDGKSKRDLLKVIHYAMLLLHFDGHYTNKNFF